MSKQLVWEAYQRVKANDGAAGVDEQSIKEFERDLKGNLYKLWNRLSSGSYFPAPVRAVDIPKADGQGVRVLGVPTMVDRIAQTVVRLYFDPKVEPMFHADSYGYRPGRSALQAVEACRERCWRTSWVIDLDIRAFFDSVDHELVLRGGTATHRQAVDPAVRGALVKAPLQQQDGTLVARDRGTPQGSSISPLLANLFLHYAFDTWMEKQFPTLRFERYCHDVVVHCTSEQQALFVRDVIGRRLARCGLELHPDKTRVVYCKDAKRRRGTYAHERFDFLGYTSRPRRSRNSKGQLWVNFSPAASDTAIKVKSRELRRWRLNLRSDQTLEDHAINSTVQGWINYYGRFYRSRLYPLLRRINEYLVRWAQRKYKRLHRRDRRAMQWLARVYERVPDLFAHWRWGARPTWALGAE
ncbi:MAG TPA: group II intron reverse transcriptase/maturase [Chloroflexota bacterium]